MAMPPQILIPFQNATPLSLRRVDRQGSLVPQRSGGANLPVSESPTTVATCEAGCGLDHDHGSAGSTELGRRARTAGQLGLECAESPLPQPAAVMPRSTGARSHSRCRQRSEKERIAESFRVELRALAAGTTLKCERSVMANAAERARNLRARETTD